MTLVGWKRTRARAEPVSHPAAEAAAAEASAEQVTEVAWLPTFTRRVAALDALVVIVAMMVAYLVRFEPEERWPVVSGDFAVSYAVLSVLLAVAWLLALTIGRTWDRRILGWGPAEYARVFRASWQLFAVVAVVAYLAKADVARGYLAVAFPLGVVLLLGERYAARQWLHRQRAAGRCMRSVLVLGGKDKAAELIQNLGYNHMAGLRVVGVCLPHAAQTGTSRIEGVPVLGDVTEAASVAKAAGADMIAVAGSDTVTGRAVRELGWQLEGTGIDLALVPALTDIAGPRVITSPVNGTALLHVDAPQFTGAKYLLKTTFDWFGALIITVVLFPLFVVLALLVATTSRGPVFYRQERAGLNGSMFTIWKFRSMYADADARLSEITHLSDGNGVLFKMRDDPRVTPVGRVMRRFSLDELPQLFNVLTGQMSLVGPRPPLPS